MNTKNMNSIRKLVGLGVGEMLKIYLYGDKLKIIKVKKIKRVDNYKIVFDGKLYYLISNNQKILSISEDKEELITEGVAKVL